MAYRRALRLLESLSSQTRTQKTLKPRNHNKQNQHKTRPLLPTKEAGKHRQTRPSTDLAFDPHQPHWHPISIYSICRIPGSLSELLRDNTSTAPASRVAWKLLLSSHQLCYTFQSCFIFLINQRFRLLHTTLDYSPLLLKTRHLSSTFFCLSTHRHQSRQLYSNPLTTYGCLLSSYTTILC